SQKEQDALHQLEIFYGPWRDPDKDLLLRPADRYLFRPDERVHDRAESASGSVRERPGGSNRYCVQGKYVHHLSPDGTGKRRAAAPWIQLRGGQYGEVP